MFLTVLLSLFSFVFSFFLLCCVCIHACATDRYFDEYDELMCPVLSFFLLCAVLCVYSRVCLLIYADTDNEHDEYMCRGNLAGSDFMENFQAQYVVGRYNHDEGRFFFGDGPAIVCQAHLFLVRIAEKRERERERARERE